MENLFGQHLKQWRKRKRYSQLQLSVDLHISSKHLSFIETGRSLPSRSMIIKIGEFLHINKREINQGLLAAGYAPFYLELDHKNKDSQHVQNAIALMINKHLPYPAFVINAQWDIMKANQAATALFSNIGYANSTNLLEAFIADQPESSKIINWHECAHNLLLRLRQNHSSYHTKQHAKLEDKLRTCSNFDEDNIYNSKDRSIIKISWNNKILSFFSILSQLHSIQDINMSEYEIELMFPADDVTVNFFTRKVV